MNFVIRRKKNVNLTMDLLSLGIYASGPQVVIYRPPISRARNGELKGSGDSGSEGDTLRFGVLDQI